MFSFFTPKTALLHDAAKRNNLSQAEKLLGMGEDINALDDYGWTPLHYAAFYEQVAMVKFLLKNGAVESVNKRAGFVKEDIVGLLSLTTFNGGETPLMLTANPQIGAMLLKAGADLHIQDEAGWSPFHWALYNMSGDSVSEFVRVLLKNETSLAIFDQRNAAGSRPIDLLRSLAPHLLEKWMKDLVKQNEAAQFLNSNEREGLNLPDDLHDLVIDIESPRPSSPRIV